MNLILTRSFLLICSICCFIAILRLPIGYYTFLRTVISIGAMILILSFLKQKSYSITIVFLLILILFNPLFPIYLHKKSIWIPFDVIVGILFLLLAFFKKAKPIAEEKIEPLAQGKLYTRDRIILSKNLSKK